MSFDAEGDGGASRIVPPTEIASAATEERASSATSLPPPFRGQVPYVLLNLVTGVAFPLFEGRNVIGRSPSPTHDVFFINLESPRSAISRVHAEVVVSPNGDVWIADGRSTNGTHIAVREGLGITLEPERFYYCVSGTRMLFGDVELTLVIDDTLMGESQLGAALGLPPQQQAAGDGLAFIPSYGRTASPSPQVVGATNNSSLPAIPRTLSDLPAGFVTRARSRSTSRRSSQPRSRASGREEDDTSDTALPLPRINFPFSGSADRMAAQLLNGASSGASGSSLLPASVPTASTTHQLTPGANNAVIGANIVMAGGSLGRTSNGSRASGDRQSVPYLMDTEDLDTTVVEVQKKAAAKRPASAAPSKVPSARAKKQPRADDDNLIEEPAKKEVRKEQAPAAVGGPVTVCLSGFDSKEKDVLTKLVKSRKGAVIDNIAASNADVLVVREPPTRTPKFLIAMGRGRPIVTARFLEDAAPLTRAYEYLPDLLHGGVRYTGKKMQQVLQAIAASKDAAVKSDGVLHGRSFYISDTVGAAKQVLVDVIKGCGGQISRKKSGDDVDLVTDADEVYRKLLTGEYTRR